MLPRAVSSPGSRDSRSLARLVAVLLALIAFQVSEFLALSLSVFRLLRYLPIRGNLLFAR